MQGFSFHCFWGFLVYFCCMLLKLGLCKQSLIVKKIQIVLYFKVKLQIRKQPPKLFCKTGVPKSFTKFTGKHLRLKKKTPAQVFPVNFSNFLRASCLQNTSGWLLFFIRVLILVAHNLTQLSIVFLSAMKRRNLSGFKYFV